ncbi:MAG: gamma-glutamyltransferase [Bacteroidota bacterium]
MRTKTKGIITAGHPQTANSAKLILGEGGNAFDAAVAALYTTFITESCMSSAGGGAFANIFTSKGHSYLFDFFCQTPIHKKSVDQAEFYPITVDFGGTTEDFHIGMGAIGVPGTIAGIYAIHEHLCTLPMHILVQPAIDVCNGGALVDDFQFFDFKVLQEILKVDQQSRGIFFPNGELVREGGFIKMEKLADFLNVLAIEGKDLFYKGEISKMVDEACQTRGGFLSRADFENYSVNILEPLRFSYEDKTILTNPMPSMGGSLMAIGLKHLENIPSGFDLHSPQHTAMFYDTLKVMDNQDKTPFGLAEKLAQLGVSFNVTTLPGAKKWGSTTHLNILDEFDNAISITSSNGEGSGYMVPGTQIMMNNMLGESALLPNGFHSWEQNVRLSSMMSPSLVLDKEGKIEYVLGSGGASRIPRAILQVIYYLIDKGLTVDEAVHAHRAHLEHKEFNLEPGFSTEIKKNIEASINLWDTQSMYFGGVHTIAKRGESFEGSGDRRRSGVVVRAD